MKKTQAIRDFEKNIIEAKTLLELSSQYPNSPEENVLLKSSIVIAIAYWEKFIEEILSDGCNYISNGLRNPLDLPTIVKQKIALNSIDSNKSSNPESFSQQVWSFAGNGWSQRYEQFTQNLTEKLNTANSEKVKECFYIVLGIEDIFDDWNKKPDSSRSLSEFDKFIDKRHEVAHGSDLALTELDGNYVKSCVDFEIELANYIEETSWKNILPIVLKSAESCSLRNKYVFDVINFFVDTQKSMCSIGDLRKISQSVYGNYRKLAYEPWGLLSINSKTEIKPTARLFQFVGNEIKLPEKIRVLQNDIALSEPNCEMMTYSQLEEIFK